MHTFLVSLVAGLLHMFTFDCGHPDISKHLKTANCSGFIHWSYWTFCLDLCL